MNAVAYSSPRSPKSQLIMLPKTSFIFLLSTSLSICGVPFYNPHYYDSEELSNILNSDVDTNGDVKNANINANGSNLMDGGAVSFSNNLIGQKNCLISIKRNYMLYLISYFSGQWICCSHRDGILWESVSGLTKLYRQPTLSYMGKAWKVFSYTVQTFWKGDGIFIIIISFCHGYAW